jgi:DNA polymerase-3 subunit chi
VTKVDFYVLGDTRPRGREHLACRLADKAYGAKQQVLINAMSAQQAGLIDELLWTFREQSFVPHARVDDKRAQPAPVVILAGGEPEQECDVLINLAAEVPGFFSRFPRVLEIIDTDPEVRTQGRERYRFYQAHGYTLNTHRL